MSEKPSRVKLKLPGEPTPAVVPMIAFTGSDRDERDVSKPIAYDEHGRPLYAPRGMVFRLRW